MNSTTAAELEVWGSGGCGVFGGGSLEDYAAPSAVGFPSIGGEAGEWLVEQLECSGTHVAAVARRGNLDTKLLCWGGNEHGQCGDPDEDLISVPRPVAGLEGRRVKFVALGWWHSVVAMEDNSVWSFGRIFQRQLNKVMPLKIEFMDKLAQVGGQLDQPPEIVGVAAGYEHSICIGKGFAVVWGNNRKMQLGISDPKIKWVDIRDPEVLLDLPDTNLCAVQCGWRHSIMLTSSGTVFSAGDNRFGQLGRSSKSSCDGFAKVDVLSEIQSIQSGWHHNLALSKNGTVYSWGRGDFGQCGQGNFEHVSFPSEIMFFRDNDIHVSEIFCGSEHCLATSHPSGTLYSWGWNEHGNLGLGHQRNECMPSEIPDFSLNKKTLLATGGASVLAFSNPSY